MSSPLPFFIKPLTVEQARRTVFSHTVRGIAYQLTSPASLSAPRHRLDFAFVLGLAPHARWYAAPNRHSAKPDSVAARLVLMLASRCWQHSLGKLDLNSIELALGNLHETQLAPACLAIERLCQLYTIYHNLSLPERHSSMHAITATTGASTIPADVMSKLEMALASLEQSLLAKDAMMPQHLRSTHSLLITYPETVHLLNDSEIALIIDAAEVHTKTEIVKPGATKSAGAGSRKKLGADDL